MTVESIVNDQIKKIQEAVEKNGTAKRTALHMAVILGQYDALRYFLANGCATQVDLVDAEGYAPLHYAAEKNDEKFIEILLQYKANPNQPFQGWHNPMDGLYFSRNKESTPLHLLLKNKTFNVKAIQALLKAEADPFLKLKQPSFPNPYEYEEKQSVLECSLYGTYRQEFIDVMISKDSYIDEKRLFATKEKLIEFAIEKNDTSLFDEICKSDSNLLTNWKLLITTIKHNNLELFDLLLPNHDLSINDLGYIALKEAIIVGNGVIVDKLLNAKVAVNDNPILLLAAKHATNKTTSIFIRLLQAGADTTTVDANGKTAADYLGENIWITLDFNEYRELIKQYRYHLGLNQFSQYKEILDARPDDDYKTKLKFFGYEIPLGFPAKDKKAAAAALDAVIKGSEEISSLNQHIFALTNGDLGDIYQNIFPILNEQQTVTAKYHK